MDLVLALLAIKLDLLFIHVVYKFGIYDFSNLEKYIINKKDSQKLNQFLFKRIG